MRPRQTCICLVSRGDQEYVLERPPAQVHQPVGMLNSSKNPSPRVRKYTDAARSLVGIVTNAGIP